MPRSVVVHDAFPWGEDRRPGTRVGRHRRLRAARQGLHRPPPGRARAAARARTPASPTRRRSSTCTSLGVTAVELLPVHHFVSEPHLLRRGLTNYWGYNSVGYFAPHAALQLQRVARRAGARVQGDGARAARRRHRGAPRRRLQPHRARATRPARRCPGAASTTSPTTASRQPTGRRYRDYTGCGNTLDVRSPARAAADHGLAALLGHRDARRRLPLRPGVRAGPVLPRRRQALGVLRRHPAGPGASARSSSSPSRGTSARAATRSGSSRRCGPSGTPSTATPCATSGAGTAGGVRDLAYRLSGQLRPLPGRRAPAVRLHQLRHRARRLHAARPDDVRGQAQRRQRRGRPRRRDAQPRPGTAASRARPTTRRSWRSALPAGAQPARDAAAVAPACRCCRWATRCAAPSCGNNNAYCQDGPLSWMPWEPDAGRPGPARLRRGGCSRCAATTRCSASAPSSPAARSARTASRTWRGSPRAGSSSPTSDWFDPGLRTLGHVPGRRRHPHAHAARRAGARRQLPAAAAHRRRRRRRRAARAALGHVVRGRARHRAGAPGGRDGRPACSPSAPGRCCCSRRCVERRRGRRRGGRTGARGGGHGAGGAGACAFPGTWRRTQERALEADGPPPPATSPPCTWSCRRAAARPRSAWRSRAAAAGARSCWSPTARCRRSGCGSGRRSRRRRAGAPRARRHGRRPATGSRSCRTPSWPCATRRPTGRQRAARRAGRPAGAARPRRARGARAGGPRRAVAARARRVRAVRAARRRRVRRAGGAGPGHRGGRPRLAPCPPTCPPAGASWPARCSARSTCTCRSPPPCRTATSAPYQELVLHCAPTSGEQAWLDGEVARTSALARRPARRPPGQSPRCSTGCRGGCSCARTCRGPPSSAPSPSSPAPACAWPPPAPCRCPAAPGCATSTGRRSTRRTGRWCSRAYAADALARSRSPDDLALHDEVLALLPALGRTPGRPAHRPARRPAVRRHAGEGRRGRAGPRRRAGRGPRRRPARARALRRGGRAAVLARVAARRRTAGSALLAPSCWRRAPVAELTRCW